MNANDVNAEMLSAGLLLVRIVAGLVMAAHGAQKLFGWFFINTHCAVTLHVAVTPYWACSGSGLADAALQQKEIGDFFNRVYSIFMLG